MRNMRSQRPGVSLGLSVSSGEDQGEKACFGEYNFLGALGMEAREDPNGMCYNHSSLGQS
jgi:hypothetical protein